MTEPKDADNVAGKFAGKKRKAQAEGKEVNGDLLKTIRRMAQIPPKAKK